MNDPRNFGTEALPASRPQPMDVALGLYWAGICLIALFLVAFFSKVWPVQLLNSAWLQNLSETLLISAPNALLGANLILLAQFVDPSAEAIAKRSRLVQRFASWAAVGFALLIPLQIYTGISLLQQMKQGEERRAAAFRSAAKDAEQATTYSELRAAIGKLPGTPPPLPETFDGQIGPARDRIAYGLDVFTKKMENKMETERLNRLNEWSGLLVRNSLFSGLLFLAFAAIGRASPTRPIFLAALPGLAIRSAATPKRTAWRR